MAAAAGRSHLLVSEEATAPAAQVAAVEELLRQLVEARFVLTDRDGAVTRWSRPAERLFGLEAYEMLGRPLMETLSLPVAAPPVGGRVETALERRDGMQVDLELVFVPVRMSQSLEFNGFLGALEQGAAGALSVERLRRGHTGVVDWIEAAIAGEGRLAEDELTAGTIVAFRPLGDVPLVESEEDETEAVPEPAMDVVDTDPEPDERAEGIERAVAGAAASAGQARAGAEAAREQAAAARSEAQAAHGEVTAAVGRVKEVEALGGRLKAELEETRRALDETRSLVAGLQEQLQDARAHDDASELVQHLRAELHQAQQAMDDKLGSIEQLRAELKEARGEARHEDKSLLESLRAELGEARAAVAEESRSLVEGLRTELGQASSEALDARERSLRTELEDTRSQLEGLRKLLEEDGGRGAELDEMRGLVEDLRGRLEEAREATPEALEAQLAETRALIESVREAQASDDLHAEVEELGKGIAQIVEGLRRELDEARQAALAGDEARSLIADMRTELSVLKAEAADGEGHDSARLREVIAEVEARLGAALEAAATAEHAAARSEETAAAVEGHATVTGEAAAAADRHAARASEALESVQDHAVRVEETAATVAQHVAAADEAAAGTREQATRAEQAASATERGASRVGEAVKVAERWATSARDAGGAAERNAARAEEAAGAAGRGAARAEETVGTIERLVARAEAAVGGAELQSERALEASDAADRSAHRASEGAGKAERSATRAAEGAAGAERSAERAVEAATNAERGAERAVPAAEAVERDAQRAADAAAAAERNAERASEEAERAARRAEEAANALEHHLLEARKAAETAAVEAEVARVQAEAAKQVGRRGSAAAPGPAERPQPARQEPRPDSRAPLFGKQRDLGPKREPRPGFDDEPNPMATIEIDGHFRELNPAFTDLVGYSEAEFSAAAWPPVMDRPNLPKHREQMRALLAGEAESVEVNTGYVHAQGLLVPVAGTLRLVRGDDGKPDHFLLSVVSPSPVKAS